MVSGAGVMVWVKTEDVLPGKTVSPLYIAVMRCDPAVSVDELNVATPEELTVAVPRCAPPSKKPTVPVGIPLPEELTVAVNVTTWP
jgi:hypothetical protein